MGRYLPSSASIYHYHIIVLKTNRVYEEAETIISIGYIPIMETSSWTKHKEV
jgi:hypothetical protein